ncbi:MAG: DUF4381 family protein [Desulfobacteraceae bacterium]|nr:DUF4381 family protein [Desulfobacteraceae bacterium]
MKPGATIFRVFLLSIILSGWTVAAWAEEPPVMPGESLQKAQPPGLQGQPPAEMNDIHDIKPLQPFPGGHTRLFIAGAVLVLLAMAAIVWWWIHRRRKREDPETVMPALPPEESARRALAELSDIERIEGRKFYFKLSLILRRYIHHRFDVGAPEMTTEEFLPVVDRLNMSTDLGRQLKAVLRRAEPVKFAGETATENTMRSDLDFAHEFIDTTTRSTHAVEADTGNTGTPATAEAG